MEAKRQNPARVWMWSLVCLGLGTFGCDENSTAVGFPPLDVQLIQPFDLDWAGKDDGAAFLAQTGEFSATASARVYWSLRITAVPEDPDDPRFTWAHGVGPPLFTKKIGFQEDIWFTWTPSQVFPGRNPFALGDVCTAELRYTPLDEEEERIAILRFVIGGHVLDEENPTPP